MATAAISVTGQRGMTRPFLCTIIFLGSFLLFLMQPMIARMALPRLGGAPAVWNSAMGVYQVLLLGGYAYAHLISRLSPQRQAGVHLALLLLAGLWLPLGLSGAAMPASASPFLWVPWLLIGSIGPLFFAVSAQAPLIQRWAAAQAPDANPYTLYVASNLGSFGGLIAYPLLVEPLMPLAAQSLAWSVGFGLLVLLMTGLALTLPSRTGTVSPAADTASRPLMRTRLLWIALAAVPSGLILATTTHLTTDIIAMPMIWVIPLGLFLLSFSFAFSDDGRIARLCTHYFPVILIVAGTMSGSGKVFNFWSSVAADIILLFGTAVVLHHRLYKVRPDAAHLTDFYLCMAIGGVVGGLLCALIAPLLFDALYEFPLLVAAAALLAPIRTDAAVLSRLQLRWMLVAGLLLSLFAGGLFWDQGPVALAIAMVALAILARRAIGYPFAFAALIVAMMFGLGGWNNVLRSIGADLRVRSYFGIYTVGKTGDARTLFHGTTVHGVQLLTPGLETRPTSYYVPLSGVGLGLRAAPLLYGPQARIGVVGLGAGTLACYAQPGQNWRFYEIDPEMVRIAHDPTKFTFLSRCLPDAAIETGDARISLAHAPDRSADILVIDAFSSDAIPMHLLTLEAIKNYGRVLSPNGLLLIHISNRYVDLKPVLAAAARDGGWQAAYRDYHPPKSEERYRAGRSIWVALTRSGRTFDDLRLYSPEKAWAPLSDERKLKPWTDDYGSILPVLRKP